MGSKEDEALRNKRKLNKLLSIQQYLESFRGYIDYIETSLDTIAANAGRNFEQEVNPLEENQQLTEAGHKAMDSPKETKDKKAKTDAKELTKENGGN